MRQARSSMNADEKRVQEGWRDPSSELLKQAKELLKRSGIRDVVLRHEGQSNEQTFSYLMAFFAANADPGKKWRLSEYVEDSCGGTCAGRHGIGKFPSGLPTAHTG